MKKSIIALSVFTILLPLVFLAFPNLDLATSGLFYVEGQGFPYRDALFSNIIFYLVRVLTVLTAMMCLYGIFYDLLFTRLQKLIPSFLKSLATKIRAKIKFTRRQLTFVLLVIIITPGILVHNVLKPIWERARPVETVNFPDQQFNRGKDFTSVFTLHAAQGGNSFPSGHASMAFALISFVYIVSAQNRKKVAIAAFSFGILASACRIWQGGHFLSDVTFSAIITLWTIVLLKRFYLDR